MSFAAAVSEHPSAADATAEVVGHVLEALGPEPDVVVLFASAVHVAHLGAIAATVEHILRPGAFIGTTAMAVIGGAREIEGEPALTLWAARLGPVETVRLEAVRTSDGLAVVGIDPTQLARAGSLILLADPATFPVDDFVDLLARDAPGLTVLGGMASAGFGPGANGFVRQGEVHADGAVGILFGADQVATTIVSQGCRPIGDPLVVTRAERNVVHEIAGRPALERLDELFARLDPHDQELVGSGLHLGRVIDEHKADFGRGDFLVRNVIGADRATGSIVVGDVVEVGATVQFHVRDAQSADEDLRGLLAGRDAASALVFTCNGRGIRLFRAPDHDAELVDLVIRGDAIAGMFCAGEIGPVGPRSFVHGFTACVALFGERP